MVYVLFVIASEEDLALVNELFINHNKELLNLAMSIVNDKNNAEDALQDGFIKIIANIRKFPAIPSPERIKFCVVIVRNISVSILRKKTNNSSIEDLGDVPNVKAQSIEDDYLEKEDIAAMLQSFQKLCPGDRQLILMRYGDGWPYKEIGNSFGISEELAKKRTQRVLSKLRKQIGL